VSRPRVLIVGLTGPNAAGKGEAARVLKGLGLAYHSLSDIIREEAVARGLTTGRDDLIATGNALRKEGGPGALAERILPRLGKRDIVDSIRNPSEVEVLRTVPGFVLLGVDAPIETRFERARGREGRGDALENLEAFRAKEEEENTRDPAAQRLRATFALADHVLANDGTIESLEANLHAWLDTFE